MGVVKELIAAFDDGAASKAECDKVIDKNGPPPKGTGIKQLRENIAESKLSYEIMDDAAQAFLKTKIMDNIQKYVYLICFTGYLREQSKAAKDAGAEEFKLSGGKASVPTENLKLAASFCTYMDAHPNFRTICEEGKGKLQWERDIPQDDHKKRAKYRFASKTLMRILPDNLKTEVETLINQKTMTLDLYEILGQCTWGQGTKGV